jgi:hypothetical protein
MGLYTNLAERFKHLQSEYSPWGMMRDDLVGPHMIDHVFTSLPDQAMRAGDPIFFSCSQGGNAAFDQ